ncbi:MAG: hypothetical protein AAFU77_05650 [Myxococcota bacterium]
MWRWLVLILLASTVACGTTYRKSRSDLPAGDREAAELGDLSDQFDAALEARRFDEAEAILGELEEGLNSADRAFILHRDYPKISGAVAQAPRSLARARKAADIEAVIEVTEQRASEVSELLAVFDSGGDRESLDDLEDALDALEEQLEDNAPVRESPRYRDVDAASRTVLIDGRSRTPRFRYQAEASDLLGEALEDLSPPAPESETLLIRAAAADANGEVFARCLEAAEEATDIDGFSQSAPLTTTLVDGPLAEVEAACADRQALARKTAGGFRWQHQVTEHYAAVSAALVAIDEAEGKGAVLAANETATPLLDRCAEVMLTEDRDREVRFRGYLGTKSAEALAEACAKVSANLSAKRPLLRWQAEFETLTNSMRSAGERVDAAETEEDLDARRNALKSAIEAMRTCDTRTVALARAQEAQWSGARIGRSAKRGAGRLQKRCRLVLGRAEKKLDALGPND